MSSYVFDLEANGLYREANTIHCIVAKDIDTQEVHKFDPSEVRSGLQLLYDADIIIGHNICGYDIPLIRKLYSKWDYKRCLDTLVISRLLYPERKGHSLESWGLYFKRSKPEHEDWSRYSEDMLFRCSEDVEINYLLYKHLSIDGWEDAIDLEQEVSRIHQGQVDTGVLFDVEHATKLVSDIDKELEEITSILDEQIPRRYQPSHAKEVGKPFKKDGTLCKRVVDWFNLEV